MKGIQIKALLKMPKTCFLWRKCNSFIKEQKLNVYIYEYLLYPTTASDKDRCVQRLVLARTDLGRDRSCADCFDDSWMCY